MDYTKFNYTAEDGVVYYDSIAIDGTAHDEAITAICKVTHSMIVVGYENGETKVMNFTDSPSASSSASLLSQDESTPTSPISLLNSFPGPRLNSSVLCLHWFSNILCCGTLNSGVTWVPLTPSDTTCNPHIVSIKDSTSSDMGEGVIAIDASKDVVAFYTTGHRCYVYTYDSLGNAAEGWDLTKVKQSSDTIGTSIPTDLGKSDDNRSLRVTVGMEDNVVVAPGGNGEVEYFKIGDDGKTWVGKKCRGGEGTAIKGITRGRWLATTNKEGNISLWDIKSNKLVKSVGEGKLDFSDFPLVGVDLEELAKEVDAKKDESKVAKSNDDDDDDDLFETIEDTPADEKKTGETEAPEDTAPQGSDDEDDDMNVDIDATQPDINEDVDEIEGKENEGEGKVLDLQTLQSMVASTKQPPFQVSSTPIFFDDSGRAPRILQWNHVGCVTSVSNGRTSSYDVQFRDSGTRRNVAFSHETDFIVGTLCDRGALMASDVLEDEIEEEIEEEIEQAGGEVSERVKESMKRDKINADRKRREGRSTGSTVHFHKFDTFGPTSTKDWTITLPGGERVLTAAAGEGAGGFCAVATTSRFLRTFTLNGVQTEIFWIPGDVVTTVARDRFLAVVYHGDGLAVSAGQNLLFKVYDMNTREVVQQGQLGCIAGDGKLMWSGFSDSLQLCVMGTDGYVSGLTGKGEWFPMLDTMALKKSREDKFWPVSVNSGKFVVVPLKGGNENPEVLRRQVTSALQVRIPIARGGVTVVAQEELFARANLALAQKKFADEDDEDGYDNMCQGLDKIALRLFQGALEANRVERCADLANRFHTEGAYDIALKLCDQADLTTGVKRGLVERVLFAKEARVTEEEEEEEDDDDDEEEDETPEDEEDERWQNLTHVTPVGKRGEEEEQEEQEQDEEVDLKAMDDSGDKETTADEKAEDEVENVVPAPAAVAPAATTGRKRNPFSKKVISPSKKHKPLDAILSPSPAKTALSRSSTFSAGTRMKKKASKRII
mmetsp:Transcript_10364/g.21332  ORF Transcript_10364/g.21332 Transcript_10364/m.21332 type:complete len:999 (-) Transcript_10364:60-3056(-)